MDTDPEHVDKESTFIITDIFLGGYNQTFSILSDSLCILKSIKTDNIYYI